MSLFLEARAQLPVRENVLATSSCSTAPLIACSAEGGHVWLVNEEVRAGGRPRSVWLTMCAQGGRVEEVELAARVNCVAMQFHPTQKTLAMGRADGECELSLNGNLSHVYQGASRSGTTVKTTPERRTQANIRQVA